MPNHLQRVEHQPIKDKDDNVHHTPKQQHGQMEDHAKDAVQEAQCAQDDVTSQLVQRVQPLTHEADEQDEHL